MIRQAISCDVCGAEKRQTNHWFVACEQAGELRLSGWNSRNRQRPGTKHLCGQTCLHKLVDEYIARTIEGRPSAGAGTSAAQHDTSLTSPLAYEQAAPSGANVARSTPAPDSRRPRPASEPATTAVVAFPAAHRMEHEAQPLPAKVEDLPEFSSRRWRAEAWERERNRELRSGERPFDVAHRRKGL